jgi:membrane-bound lytic murein transglycosylase B
MLTRRARIDRPLFIALVLAGCADTSRQPPIFLPPVTPVPVQPAPTPTPPAQPNAMSFEAWLSSYRVKALAAGIPAGVLDRELSGLTPNMQVAAQDTKQPEFSKPVSDYLKGVVSDTRVTQGQAFREDLSYLPAIEQRYGVPRETVLAVWAMESAFGKLQGNFDIVRSLATLAWEGRRRAWAEGELTAALRIIATGEASRSRLKGSWAGAMGQTQFLPSVFLSTAVDGDGDGRRDIWGSTHDALASTANYLAKAGWQQGQGWAEEVILPAGFDYSLAEGDKLAPPAWEAMGVKRADGRAWSSAELAAPSQLLLPSGARGPAFLALPNHFAIRKYNNSMSYALGIGMLADRFAGESGVVTPWPYEVPLSLAARQQAQRDLARLGFDPGAPDGVIGANSRAALRAWQKSRGLPADGYLSLAMVQRLQTEAAAIP